MGNNGCPGGPCPYNDWSRALAAQLRQRQTMIQATINAADLDVYNTVETGQWITDNGGEHFGRADPCAREHYATLLAGWSQLPTPPTNDW